MNSKTALKKLYEMVGKETYERIIQTLAGSIVYFPIPTAYPDRVERDQQIRDDFYSGQYDVHDLANKYGLSISRVYKIIQKQ